jgi:putative sigma-54 modulation protein
VRTIVKGKNLDVAEPDRRYAVRKMHRLERYLDDRSEAVVELSHERHRSADASHIVEVTLVIDGAPLRGAASAATYHAALDIVVDKLERRAIAYKEKPKRRSRPIQERQLLRSIADGTAEEASDARREVVKFKRFAIEPMFEEDAVARMEELGHSFFVFVNAENERLAVLYRRNDGNFGLIEPTIGGLYTPAGNGAGPGGRRKG